MKFCNAENYDFVLWNKKSWISERIYANSDFVNNAIAKTVDFIKLGIFPELVGRWYTKQSLQSDQPSFIQSLSIQSLSTQSSSTQSSSSQSSSSQSSSTQSSSTQSSSMHSAIIHPVIIIILSARILSATMWQTDVE